MDDIRTTLLPTFLQEAEGKLPVIGSFLAKRAAESCDLVAMDAACRAAHTLKGTAGLIKADSIRRIAMRIEDILENHVQKKTSPSVVEYDALNLAQERMAFLVGCLASSEPEPKGMIEGVMQALELVTTFPGQSGAALVASDDGSVADPFSEDGDFDLSGSSDERGSVAASIAQEERDAFSEEQADMLLPEDPFAEDPFELSDGDPALPLSQGQPVPAGIDPFAEDPDFEPVTGEQNDVLSGAQPKAGEEGSQDFACCCFELSGRQYSIPIENMVEISELPPVVDLPLSPVHIHGMVNLRGKVLPLVDIGACEGSPSAPALNRRMVVVDAQGEEYAFLCEGVPSLEAEFSGLRIDPIEFKLRYSIGAS